MREAVLLMTHFYSEEIVQRVRRLRRELSDRYEVMILLDATASGRTYEEQDIEVYEFHHRDLFSTHSLFDWFKHRLLAPGPATANIVIHSIFRFASEHPSYDRVWVMEYDVEFSGRWSVIFDAFSDSPSDLLATNVHRYEVHPQLIQWRKLRSPDGYVPEKDRVRAFFPFHRWSRRGLNAAQSAWEQGWRGIYETWVPTALARSGLRIEDFGGTGEFVDPRNVRRFYTSTPGNRGMGPGSFVFRPIRETQGERPNTLWHPVKTEKAPLPWDEKPPGIQARIKKITRRVF